MMQLFRLPPLVYFVLAPILLALCIFWFVTDSNRDAERAAALSHDPPKPIAVQALKSGDSGSDFNEIVIRGQADVASMVELSKTKNGRTIGTDLFIPLYPTDAKDLNGPVTAVLEIRGNATDEQVEAMFESEGPAGPVLVANGVLYDGTNSDARKAFDKRKTVAADLYTIQPFMNGRKEGLRASGRAPNWLYTGLILAAALGGYGFFRKRQLDAAARRNQYDPF
jgi:hypothetical protein